MTGRQLRTGAALLVATFSVATLSWNAGAQPHPPKPAAAAKPLAQALTGQAKADYEAGKTLAGDGDFAGALIKFQSAYDQSKDPRLLWNVAFCEKNNRHYSRVISTLNRYVAEGNGYLTDKDRKDAQDLIATLQPFTTNLTIKVSEDGAQVSIDDAPVGTSPLTAPVVLDIGERHIRVTKDGFKPFEKALPVGGSAAVYLDVPLAKEVHEGRLIVNAPIDATLVLDDKEIGKGKMEMKVAAGGHQVRETAPGMRPFQTEIVIQDGEARQLDVQLEKLPEPEKPKVRVAVGCDGPEPVGPDDGLVVYLDGPDVLPPVNVKKKWDDQQSRNVVEYVEYAVDAGSHTIRARIPECVSLDTTVQVDPTAGAVVTGALESDTPGIMSGPQGSPGHWRIGANLWMFKPSDTYQSNRMPEAYAGGLGAATGGAIEGALVWRWFGMFMQGAYGSGSVTRHTFNSNDVLPGTTNFSVVEGSFRMSFRLPFNMVSWNVIGPETGAAQVNVKDVDTGKVQPLFGLWTGVDVQPFCDWGASVLGDVQGLGNSSGGPGATLQVGFFFEPNSRCRRERSTEFGLRTGGK
jgi:hypothetical protein